MEPMTTEALISAVLAWEMAYERPFFVIPQPVVWEWPEYKIGEMRIFLN
jgi:hypothetical protein